jgi:hypothetical protein
MSIIDKLKDRNKYFQQDFTPIEKEPPPLSREDLHKLRLNMRRTNYPIDVKPLEQLKKYSLNNVAHFAYSFQMDIVYFGRYKYLIMIGHNNRYVYGVPINSRNKVDIEDALHRLTTIINAPRYNIDCDGEGSFSHMNNKFLTSHNISIHSKPDNYHNRLSIINRVVRTIRDYAFKLSESEDIDVDLLNNVMYYYNHYPHRTLSQAIGFYVSPAEVKDDFDLEAFIAKKLLLENIENKNKDNLKVGDTVALYNVEDKFKKRRFTTDKRPYKIISKVGNMFEIVLKNNIYGEKSIVPRYYLLKL